MFRLFVASSDIKLNEITIDSETHHHLKTVIRIRSGEMLDIIVDGTHYYQAVLHSIMPNRLSVEKMTFVCEKPELFPLVYIAQALPKAEKFSDILNACTQFGVSGFIPIQTQYTIPKVNQKAGNKLKRWQTVLKNASSQSKQYAIPTLFPFMSISELIQASSFQNMDLKIVLWENEAKAHLKTVLNSCSSPPKAIIMVVGPEGGFHESEIQQLQKAGFQSASMGNTVLRVENAAFAALSMIRYSFS